MGVCLYGVTILFLMFLMQFLTIFRVSVTLMVMLKLVNYYFMTCYSKLEPAFLELC
jgi:hypothetical protein